MNDTNPSPSTLSADDARVPFAASVTLLRRVADGVTDEQLHLPTPCGDMDVETLLVHISAVLRRVVAMGTGANPFAITPAVPRSGQTWSDAWLEVAHEIHAVWSDALLDQPMSLPWLQTNGAGILGHYTAELTIHTWDLAKATGQQPDFDPHAVETAFAAYRHALPAEGRVAAFEAVAAQLPKGSAPLAPPFGEVRPVRPDAPMVDQVAAWTGRDPEWTDA
jgi:uncharacterized protein (TIGR03086 family)